MRRGWCLGSEDFKKQLVKEMEGKLEKEIFAVRDRKLESARQHRQAKRQAARENFPLSSGPSSLTTQAAPERIGPSRETEAGSAEEQPAEGQRDEATK